MSSRRTRRTANPASNKRHELEDSMGPSESSHKKRAPLPYSSRKIASKVQKSTSNRGKSTTKSRQTAAQGARNGSLF